MPVNAGKIPDEINYQTEYELEGAARGSISEKQLIAIKTYHEMGFPGPRISKLTGVPTDSVYKLILGRWGKLKDVETNPELKEHWNEKRKEFIDEAYKKVKTMMDNIDVEKIKRADLKDTVNAIATLMTQIVNVLGTVKRTSETTEEVSIVKSMDDQKLDTFIASSLNVLEGARGIKYKRTTKQTTEEGPPRPSQDEPQSPDEPPSSNGADSQDEPQPQDGANDQSGINASNDPFTNVCNACADGPPTNQESTLSFVDDPELFSPSPSLSDIERLCPRTGTDPSGKADRGDDPEWEGNDTGRSDKGDNSGRLDVVGVEESAGEGTNSPRETAAATNDFRDRFRRTLVYKRPSGDLVEDPNGTDGQGMSPIFDNAGG